MKIVFKNATDLCLFHTVAPKYRDLELKDKIKKKSPQLNSLLTKKLQHSMTQSPVSYKTHMRFPIKHRASLPCHFRYIFNKAWSLSYSE